MDTPRKPAPPKPKPKQKLPKPKTTAAKPGRPAARKKSKTLSPAEAHRSVREARWLLLDIDETIKAIDDPLEAIIWLISKGTGADSLLKKKLVAAREHVKEASNLLAEAGSIALDSASIILAINLMKKYFSEENKKRQSKVQVDAILKALGLRADQVLHRGMLTAEEKGSLRVMAKEEGLLSSNKNTNDLISAFKKRNLPDITTAGGKIAIKRKATRDSCATTVVARLCHLSARHVREFDIDENRYQIPDHETKKAFDLMKPPEIPATDLSTDEFMSLLLP